MYRHVLLLALFSAGSFLIYGVSCLASTHMRKEFERFGLARMRGLTGVLQLLGAAGLLAGVWFPLLGGVAAGGLALLMLLGFGVRLKLQDTVLQSSPALLYLVLNAYLAFAFAGVV